MIRRRALLAACAAAVLAGCAGEPRGDDHPTGRSATGSTEPATDSTAEVARLVAAADLDACPAESAEPPASSELPDLTLPCLGEGPAVNLAGLTGRPYVVVVWAGYCGPCATEAPYLQEVYEEAEDAVGFLGIDLLEPRDFGLEAALRWGVGYPSVHDADALTRPALRFVAPPTTIFLRADGSIAGQETGSFDSADEVRSAIRTYLGVEL